MGSFVGRTDGYAVGSRDERAGQAAQAPAWATWTALQGQSAAIIRTEIEKRFKYDLHRDWFSGYEFDVTCQGTVPPALICALGATDYEDFIRQAVSIGGDTDTICAIGGAVAAALYGIPDTIISETKARLDTFLLDIIDQFERRFIRLSLIHI